MLADWLSANFLHWAWHTRACWVYLIQTGNTPRVVGGGGVLRVGGFYGERGVWFYVLPCGGLCGACVLHRRIVRDIMQ